MEVRRTIEEIRAELATANTQLDALEESRRQVIALLEQEQAAHAATKATLAEYRRHVRTITYAITMPSLVAALDRLGDLNLAE